MSTWWLKVADEIAAMRQMGAERPEAVIPELFADAPEGPVIETTHRVVKRVEPKLPAVPEASRPAAEYRFQPNGRLIDSAGESFLSRGRKKRGSWS